MRCIKESFIDRYIEVLVHKVRQELNEKLEDVFFFAEGIEKANEVVHEITKQ